MKIFNTMTRKKEELVPVHPGEVRIYSCGPTVYNFSTWATPGRSSFLIRCAAIWNIADIR